MAQRTNRKVVDRKIIPLEIIDRTKEVKIMKIGEEENMKIKKKKKNASTYKTRVMLLEMIAWYFVPVIYIIFSVTYFTIYYCMF